MVNTKAIRKVLIDMDMGVKDLAANVGKSYATTTLKLNGERDMTLEEAEKWQEFLEIADQDFAYYFLNHEPVVWNY